MNKKHVLNRTFMCLIGIGFFGLLSFSKVEFTKENPNQSGVMAKGNRSQPRLRKITHADRLAAAARQAKKGIKGKGIYTPPQPGGTPNYFGPEGNYANSPLPVIENGEVVPNTGIRKFVDSLAGLGPEGANNLGNYIPVAVPDVTKYPGSDYTCSSRIYSTDAHRSSRRNTIKGICSNKYNPPI